MEFTRKQVEEIIGMSAARVRLCGDRGLLTLNTQFPGRGIGRVYTWVNLLELAIINEFFKHGLEFGKIQIVFDHLKKYFPEILQRENYDKDVNFYIIVYSDEHPMFTATRQNEAMKDILKGNSSAVIVDVNKLVKSLP